MKPSDSILWHVTDDTIERVFGDMHKKHSSKEEFNELLSKINTICPGLQQLHKFSVASILSKNDKALAQCGVVLSLLMEIYNIEQGLKLKKDLNG